MVSTEAGIIRGEVYLTTGAFMTVAYGLDKMGMVLLWKECLVSYDIIVKYYNTASATHWLNSFHDYTMNYRFLNLLSVRLNLEYFWLVLKKIVLAW